MYGQGRREEHRLPLLSSRIQSQKPPLGKLGCFRAISNTKRTGGQPIAPSIRHHHPLRLAELIQERARSRKKAKVASHRALHTLPPLCHYLRLILLDALPHIFFFSSCQSSAIFSFSFRHLIFPRSCSCSGLFDRMGE